jgi:hypothetical protein
MNIWAGFVKTNTAKSWTFVGAWRNSKIAMQETHKHHTGLTGKAKIHLYAPYEKVKKLKKK